VSVAKRGRGRPPGESVTRDAIIRSARQQFAERGYRATSLRSIGQAAGVDARLVLHYFGSKRDLLTESVELPIEPEEAITTVFADGNEHVPENAARLLVSILEDPDSRRPLVALLRAAVAEEEAADLIRDLLTRRLLLPIATRLGGEDAPLRASFVASQLVGITIVRYVVKIPPMAIASREDLVRALVPVFEHYLHGQWGEAPVNS
jgi:AcrR family transcriptional regulator